MEKRPKNWDWLDALPGELDDDVVQAVNEGVPQQERPALDKFSDLDWHPPE